MGVKKLRFRQIYVAGFLDVKIGKFWMCSIDCAEISGVEELASTLSCVQLGQPFVLTSVIVHSNMNTSSS